MQQQLWEEGHKTGFEFTWKPKSMSVRYLFHKMALIVEAGLGALGIEPRRIWHSNLGGFPPVQVMAVSEEDEELEHGISDRAWSEESALDEDGIDSQLDYDLYGNNSGSDWNLNSDCDSN